MSLHTAYIALGSNLAPEQNIEAALEALVLCTELKLTGISRFCRTAAIGRPDEPDFLNGVVSVETPLAAEALKFNVLREIEARLGRARGGDRYAPRTIDLDILLHGDTAIETPSVRIPDPDLRTRNFLAAGLLELWPEAALPDGTSVSDFFAGAAGAGLAWDDDFSRRMKTRFLK